MKRFLDWLKQHKIEAICVGVGLLVGLCALVVILLMNGSAKVVTVDRDNYALKYDSAWKLEENEDGLVLKRGNEAKIIIQTRELNDEYRFLSMDELIDKLMREIQRQNEDYSLLSTKEARLTKNQYDGYKLLYENGGEQVMVAMYKQGNQLVVITYEASSEYFDILLDSVNSIINSLEIKEKKFDLSDSLKLSLSNAEYGSSSELDDKLDGTVAYEIAKHNYLVKYTIPTSFVRTELNSTWGYYTLDLESGRIVIMVDVLGRNIYEYLDHEDKTSVYQSYKSCQESGECADFQESVSKINGEAEEYIYKNRYSSKAIRYNGMEREEYNRQDENVELLYALGNAHTLKITIKSTGVPITEKLIGMIKVGAVVNYASYIKVEKEDGNLIGRLQRYTNSERNMIDSIILRVPEKYIEIDEGDNIYTDRYYGLDFDEEMDFYGYEVHYGLTTLSGETIIKNINSVKMKTAYGEAKELTFAGDITLGGKNFQLYTGGYTDMSGIMYTNTNRKKYYVNKSVLVYEIPSKGTLYIEIDGNGKEVTKEILSELVNFVIEEEKI